MDPVSGLHRSNLKGVCALEKTDPYEELVRFIMWLTARVPYNGKRTHDVDMIRATSIRSYVSQAVTRTALETDERLVYTPKTKMLLSRLMSLPVPVLFKEPIPALVIANIIDDEGISMGTRAAIMLAWFLTMRLGDGLVSQLTTEFLAARQVLRRDVEFIYNDDICVAVRITTHGSKSDKYNEGGVKYFRRAVDEGDFCPVEFFLDYWAYTERCGFRDDEPLLRHPDGSLVTHRHVADQLKRHAALLGYDPAWFACHSTRIGSTTAMWGAGLPMPVLRKQGGWRSKLGMGPYMRPNDDTLQLISSALALRTVSGQGVGGVKLGALFCRPRPIRSNHVPKP